MVVAAPLLRLAIKGLGIGYLLWLAWKLAHSARLAEADAAQLTVGFWQGVALQFVNIKAWLLALTIVAGWVAGRADALQRLAVVLPVMVVFAFTSNLTYAADRRAAAPVAGTGKPPAVVQPLHGRGAGAHRRLDGHRMNTTHRPQTPGPPHRRNPGPGPGPAGRGHLCPDPAHDAAGRGHARCAADVGRVHRHGPRGGGGRAARRPFLLGARVHPGPSAPTGGRWP